MAAGAAGAFLIGMITKPILKRINVIGVDEKTRKEEGSLFKDIVTGGIDGLSAPAVLAKSMLLGIPLVLGINSLTRYMSIKKNDKSFRDYLNQQTQNLGVKTIAALTVITMARKTHMDVKSWESAFKKAIENSKNLKPFEELVFRPAEFEELANKIQILQNSKIVEILGDKELSIEAKMLALENENIFIPKYLQTIPDNLMEMFGNEELGQIITRFKSDCPVSRTVGQAQKIISNTYGDKYIVQGDKALGVGTVAETYVAKERDTGREVVIKLLKEGMSLEKIERDKSNILQMLKQANIEDHKQMDYFVRRINLLFDTWKQELDLVLEHDAALVLGQNARNYIAIKPIEVKDNIYVMEKALGVQFNKFVDYLGQNGKQITKKEIGLLLLNYFKVFFEQLLSVPKAGMKVMHADPHPGNVFIDMDNRTTPFTFIDTGNVLRYTPEEAITNTFNHLDYLIGNTNAIAKTMLRGASLPEGMTKEDAIMLLTKELNEKIYNNKQKLPIAMIKTVNDFCLETMEKYHIISNPNNTNLLKAESTYLSNIISLQGIEKHIKDLLDDNNFELNKEMEQQLKLMAEEIQNSITNAMLNNKKHTISEIKARINFISKNKEQFLTTIFKLGKLTDV